MKFAALSVLFFLTAVDPLLGQEKKIGAREIDKQIFDVLKEVHNRGADIYNGGDSPGCYRLFQGSLQTCRALLTHRPDEQKFIDEALAEAEKEASVSQRAFVLHSSIEKLRSRLRSTPALKEGKEPEALLPPRETKPAEKEMPREIKPTEKKKDEDRELLPYPRSLKEKNLKNISAPKEGVMGRVFWNGKPLDGAHVMLVSRGAMDIRVFESDSNAEGGYWIEEIRSGLYTVLLTKTLGNKQCLPERYATATWSPLIAEVKRGERLDFMLQ